ncbi:hypothetical protein [Candidatus Magnetomonas plexicatena]
MYANVLIRVLKYAIPVIVTLMEKSSLLDFVIGSKNTDVRETAKK